MLGLGFGGTSGKCTTSEAITEPSLSSLISLRSVCEDVEEPREAPLGSRV